MMIYPNNHEDVLTDAYISKHERPLSSIEKLRSHLLDEIYYHTQTRGGLVAQPQFTV